MCFCSQPTSWGALKNSRLSYLRKDITATVNYPKIHVRQTPSTTVDSFVMFEQIVAGTGHPKKEQQKWFGTESSSWYKRIQTQLFSELYGESSFLQEYMRSEASSENYHVAITNWELEAKILRLARAFPSAL
ncbi:hypothetical protein HBI82_147760 [Parastagonospora nodorum]|nr:hypothetical protein HBH52_090520 [Parastagonospora nodorum]KAH5679894.1 hypothetical protein HBI21_074010 [Parastagonospora nodorum]KAH6005669.1 hypothetical protein HBI82_147760 [Parastagonospora nodorum]KAH6417173.1 hypothetical protein HBI14_107270 [Parastagonospora nodorum]